MASDSAFMVVRRFRALNTRIALSMQGEIVQLEQELDDIDKGLCDPAQDMYIINGIFRHDPFD